MFPMGPLQLPSYSLPYESNVLLVNPERAFLW
jgi:hypothetical protein